MSSRASAPLQRARRLVVKIGSSILVDEAKGEVRRDWLEALTNDVARLHKGGCEIVLVSSGALGKWGHRCRAATRHTAGWFRRWCVVVFAGPAQNRPAFSGRCTTSVSWS